MECLLCAHSYVNRIYLSPLECPKFYLYKMWICSTHFPVQNASVHSPLLSGSSLRWHSSKSGPRLTFQASYEGWQSLSATITGTMFLPDMILLNHPHWLCKENRERVPRDPAQRHDSRSWVLGMASQRLVWVYEKSVAREWPERLEWAVRWGAGGFCGCCKGRDQGKSEEKPIGLFLGHSQGALQASSGLPAAPFGHSSECPCRRALSLPASACPLLGVNHQKALLKRLPGHCWTLRACSERAGIGLNRAKNSMAGSAVLSEHIKDSDISNSVQSMHTHSEVEERWIDLVRIVERGKVICSGFKSLPRHLAMMSPGTYNCWQMI